TDAGRDALPAIAHVLHMQLVQDPRFVGAHVPALPAIVRIGLEIRFAEMAGRAAGREGRGALAARTERTDRLRGVRAGLGRRFDEDAGRATVGSLLVASAEVRLGGAGLNEQADEGEHERGANDASLHGGFPTERWEGTRAM